MRRMMLGVAIASLISLGFAKVCREHPETHTRVVILLTCVIAGAVGFWSIRRPIYSLLAVVVACEVVGYLATDDDSDMFGESCLVAWIIGAFVGWLSKKLRRLRANIIASKGPK